MPGFDAGIWLGLLAPASTPPAIIERISVAANEALKTEMVDKALRTQGIDVLGGTPQEFAAYVAADLAKWSTLAKSAGLKLD